MYVFNRQRSIQIWLTDYWNYTNLSRSRNINYYNSLRESHKFTVPSISAPLFIAATRIANTTRNKLLYESSTGGHVCFAWYKTYLVHYTQAMERGLIRGGNNGIPDFFLSDCWSTFSSPSVVTNISPREWLNDWR